MSRIQKLFQRKGQNVLNIYFTAGYPSLQDTQTIIETLDKSGADIVEVGMPYSDPMADGPTIQESGDVALRNGMNVALLFEQIVAVRKNSEIPIILMGYYNQVMQFGEEKFFRKCKEVGVDGLILPDMPLHVFEEQNKSLFKELGLDCIFLITPQTSDERIKVIDSLSSGFIYMVSNSSITGAKTGISEKQLSYFNRINNLNLKNPRLIGFGISNHETFTTACQYSNGAIIGSAFIRAIGKEGNLENKIGEFVDSVLNKETATK